MVISRVIIMVIRTVIMIVIVGCNIATPRLWGCTQVCRLRPVGASAICRLVAGAGSWVLTVRDLGIIGQGSLVRIGSH